MSRVIVSGSVAYDRIMDFDGLFADHFVPEKIRSINLSFQVDKLSVGYGGTAGNIAYNLALLGVQTDILATVGGDFEKYRSHMLLSGVNPASICVVESEMTASAEVFTDKADNQISAFYPGAGRHPYDTPIDTDGRSMAIVAPGCLSDMKLLPALYRKRGFPFMYDPAQAISALSLEDLQDGMHGAHILFGSDYEFGLIRQKTGWTEQVMLQHVPVIVVTHGAEGSRILTREGETHVHATSVKEVRDPTGAGDAYRAGFIRGMLAGFPPHECACLASTVAAYAVESHGTQTHHFTMEGLEKRYKEAYGKSLAL